MIWHNITALFKKRSHIIPRKKHSISRRDIHEDALKVLYRLKKAGYDAYLVGGGVRDLLLGLSPKDFDIVTNALPDDVRALFRNCRLIGRRFRLAHIYFGGHIVEVATFRGPSDQANGNGLITRDNTYGACLKTDANRRDFTINALYYNIADFSVVDMTGGWEDIQKRQIRMIGQPIQRYQEDPVRMIRAIRFSAKLNFHIEKRTAAAIIKCAGLLGEVPSARLYDELCKLIHAGCAQAIFDQLNHFQLMPVLFPVLSHYQDEGQHLKMTQQVMKNTDARLQEGKIVTMAYILSALLWLPLQQMLAKQPKSSRYTERLDNAMAQLWQMQLPRVAIPKRILWTTQDIWRLQKKFQFTNNEKNVAELMHASKFRAAWDLYQLRAWCGDDSASHMSWWQAHLQANPVPQTPKSSKRKPRRYYQKNKANRSKGQDSASEG